MVSSNFSSAEFYRKLEELRVKFEDLWVVDAKLEWLRAQDGVKLNSSVNLNIPGNRDISPLSQGTVFRFTLGYKHEFDVTAEVAEKNPIKELGQYFNLADDFWDKAMVAFSEIEAAGKALAESHFASWCDTVSGHVDVSSEDFQPSLDLLVTASNRMMIDAREDVADLGEKMHGDPWFGTAADSFWLYFYDDFDEVRANILWGLRNVHSMYAAASEISEFAQVALLEYTSMFCDSFETQLAQRAAAEAETTLTEQLDWVTAVSSLLAAVSVFDPPKAAVFVGISAISAGISGVLPSSPTPKAEDIENVAHDNPVQMEQAFQSALEQKVLAVKSKNDQELASLAEKLDGMLLDMQKSHMLSSSAAFSEDLNPENFQHISVR